MGLSNNEILLRLLIVIAFVVMLPAALLWALGLEPGTLKRKTNQADETFIQERAVAIAESEYEGSGQAVQARRMTMGEAGAVTCSPLGAMYSMVVDFLQGNLNWCDPNTEVWVVDVKGKFRADDTVVESLAVMLDGNGKLVRVGTGAR
jgi:hypothetical protein